MWKKAGTDLRATLTGLKSLLSRNSLLIIAIFILNQYSNTMKNAVRTSIGANELGLTATVVGTALSVYMVSGMLFRAPSGAVTDRMRRELKWILAGSMLVKSICYLCFGLVRAKLGYYAVFFFDGILYSFTSTAIPAILALSVDRRAIGSGFSVMVGLAKVITASARQVGLGLYSTRGILSVVAVTTAIHLAAALMALAMDGTKLTEESSAAPKSAPAPHKKGRTGILWGMLPLAVVFALTTVMVDFEVNYFPLFSQKYNFKFTDITTIGGSIAGFVSIGAGFLCDFVNPAVIIVLALAGQCIPPLLWAQVSSPPLIRLGVWISCLTRFHSTSIRILGMKAVSRADQGAYSGTMQLVDNFFNIFSALFMGIIMDNCGYITLFKSFFVLNLLTALSFVCLYFTKIKAIMRQNT